MLFNLHAYDLIAELTELLNDLNGKKFPLWQQMRTIEILSALLAEELMRNGTQFNLDPEEIIWPDGTISKPPLNEKGPRGGRRKKNNPNSKNGIFRKVVNEYGPKNKTSVQPQDTVIVTPQQQTAATEQDAQATLSKEDPTKKGTLIVWHIVH